MSVFKAYDDRVEITGLTKDSNYTTVDFSSYVDSGAVGAIVEWDNTSASEILGLGIQDTQTPAAQRLNDLLGNTSLIFIVPLDENKQMDMKLVHANVDVFIHGECHSGVKLRRIDAWISHQNTAAQRNMWITKTLSAQGTDTVADMEAGLFQGWWIRNAGVWAVRKVGSTITETQANKDDNRFHTEICGVDSNGQFEHVSSGHGAEKGGTAAIHARVYEIGYVKKQAWKSILNPASAGPPGNTAFTDLDLSGTITSTTSTVAIRITPEVAGTWLAYARSNGSTNPTNGVWSNSRIIHYIKVNRDQLVEVYNAAGGNNGFFVLGYEDSAAQGQNTVVIDGGNLNKDEADLIIG